MTGAMKTRLRVTGFGIVIAALIANWAFGQDAQPTAGAALAPAAEAKAATTATPSTTDPLRSESVV